MEPKVLLGTSGWTYKHWAGIFYPEGVPQKRWFEYFAQHFSTVEINASFYRIPSVKTVEGWRDRSPEHFRFAVKVSRLITHLKKLRNCTHEIEWFFTTFAPLSPKIGIYLVQLPPSLKRDVTLLRDFAAMLPFGIKASFEFRNATWYREETYLLLDDIGHSFCIHDMSGLTTERIVTSRTAYVRFHGYDSMYGGDYPQEVLQNWAGWIADQHKAGIRVFGYFNNDIGGCAVKNCRVLIEMLSLPSVPKAEEYVVTRR